MSPTERPPTLEELNARAAELGMPPISREEYDLLAAYDGLAWGDGEDDAATQLEP